MHERDLNNTVTPNPKLAIDYCGIKMKNPIIAASGTFGNGPEYAGYLDLSNEIGAISVKGLTPKGRHGNPGTRIAETPSGVLNCIGLENPGAEHFVREILPELKKYDVQILINTEADAGRIASYAPYAIVLATGGTPIKPSSIPGSDLEEEVTFKEVLCDEKVLEGRKVTVIGSGATGLETAEFLCARGNEVTIVEMLDSIGQGVYVQHYLDAMDKLSKYDITYKPKTRLAEIKKDAAVLEHLEDGTFEEYPSDYVVLAMGVRSVNPLEQACKEICDKVIVAGDAKQVGRIEGAVRSGFEAAYTLQ